MYKNNRNIWDALGISGSTKLPNAHIIEDYTIDEDDMTNALTLGHKVDENSCLVVLFSTCVIVLLKSSILPNYKLFQFVDGKIEVVTSIFNVQAIRYIIDVIHQATKYLLMSPIETIRFSYLGHCSLCCSQHGSVVSKFICHILDPKEEKNIVLNDYIIITTHVNMWHFVGMVVGSVVMAFVILVEWHVLKISLSNATRAISFCWLLSCKHFQLSNPIRFLLQEHGLFFQPLGV
jgi:hypothetical protein